MYNLNKRLVFQILVASTVLLAKQYAWAGQYDDQVLDEVSAKEFIMILDQPVPKIFKRTQLPNAFNNLCTVNNGQASSLSIASKLRVVGGSGAVSTLQVATGTNPGTNTSATANTTVQNNSNTSNNKPNSNSNINSSTNNRTNSGEVLNTQTTTNQTSAANNTNYVPSLPTPRTNSVNANTTSNSNGSIAGINNSTSNINNAASTNATRTNNNVTVNANANANATASNVRVNNQANGVQTAQNTPTRIASTPRVSQNNTNANVPYVGNAIATVNLAVNFGNDSDKLSAKDKILLKELALALNSTALRQSEFAIVGHTSSTGPYLRNLELSCARAIAVRNHLVILGVKAARLTPYGFGPDKPLANIAAQEVGNRRVEISRAK